MKFANGRFKTVKATDVELDDLNRKTMQKIALNNVIKKVKSDVKRFKKTELEVGDFFVRVKTSAISNAMRRMVKQGNEKLLAVKYSPMIFQVVNKINPKNGLLERNTYYVKDLTGRSLLGEETPYRE